MNKKNKTLKEQRIIEAAEKVFSIYGFKNTKMEVVAEEAGITKVTLYSYFQSKENLYFGITYRALRLLVDEYYYIIDKNRNKKGLDSVLELAEYFMSFCENNFLYSEALLEYFAINRSTALGSNDIKLTESIKESIYFNKLQDLQNLPFKLITGEIERGKTDGSIHPDIDAMTYTIQGWSMVIGYIKIISSSGNVAAPLFKVKLKDLKQITLKLCKESFNYNIKA